MTIVSVGRKPYARFDEGVVGTWVRKIILNAPLLHSTTCPAIFRASSGERSPEFIEGRSRTIRCGHDVEVLCGCVPGRFRGSGRDAGGKMKGEGIKKESKYSGLGIFVCIILVSMVFVLPSAMEQTTWVRSYSESDGLPQLYKDIWRSVQPMHSRCYYKGGRIVAITKDGKRCRSNLRSRFH